MDSTMHSPGLCSAPMVASIVNTPLSAIERWTRRGYLRACSESCDKLGELPRYDFDEVRVARTLAEICSTGVSQARLDQIVDQLHENAPPGQRPLADWDLKIEGGAIVVQVAGQRCDAAGQRLLEFDGQGDQGPSCQKTPSIPLKVHNHADSQRARARVLSRAGDLEEPVAIYRELLVTGYGQPQDHFELAELLYRSGDLGGARERLFVCLEFEPDHLEARFSLGRLLAEEGEWDLAEAALAGVLDQDPGHADAQGVLAEVFEKTGRSGPADQCQPQLRPHSPGDP